MEITEQAFRCSLQVDEAGVKYPDWIPSLSKPITVLAEVELVSGARVFLKVRTRQVHRMPLDVSMALHHLFTVGGIHAQRCGGGVILLNPAGIVRVALYSGPTVPAPGAWQASSVSG